MKTILFCLSLLILSSCGNGGGICGCGPTETSAVATTDSTVTVDSTIDTYQAHLDSIATN